MFTKILNWLKVKLLWKSIKQLENQERCFICKTDSFKKYKFFLKEEVKVIDELLSGDLLLNFTSWVGDEPFYDPNICLDCFLEEHRFVLRSLVLRSMIRTIGEPVEHRAKEAVRVVKSYIYCDIYKLPYSKVKEYLG